LWRRILCRRRQLAYHQWRTAVRRYESNVKNGAQGKATATATAARSRFAGPGAANSKATSSATAKAKSRRDAGATNTGAPKHWQAPPKSGPGVIR
jgi:hypothetical protein